MGGQQLGRADRPQRQTPSQDPRLGHVSYRALSQLHAVPQKTTINGEYYRNNILANECLEALNRTAREGSVSERALIDDPSQAVFMQDGAPPHSAKKT